MEKDSREGLNMSGITHTVSNLKNDMLGLANVIESTLLPKVSAMAKEFETMASSMSGIFGGAGNGGKQSVAFSPASGASKAAGMAVGLYGAANTAMPGVNTSVMQDFLTQRSAFYGQGGYGGNLMGQTSSINALQRALAKQGTMLNSMDSSNMLAMAQSTGLSGVSNFNQVMSGAAQASNFTPGIGGANAVAAIGGTMNSANTVNLARTIGINIRQADGSMLPFPQMIDKLWSFINQQSGGRGMDKKSLQYSLQPGYGLYNMLNGLFGGDPVMIKMAADALLAKATFHGQALGTITKDQMVGAGIQSATVKAMAGQAAAQTNNLINSAAATSGGYAVSADAAAAMNNLATALGPFTAMFGALHGLTSGLGAIGGGALKTVLGLFGIKGMLAGGGPADGNAPYIVGEKGPELFVPKSDGVVIPNHLLNNPHREDGGPVKFAKQLLQGLGATATPEAIANIVMWEGKEGGNWHNTAKFNPLNTSYQLGGSTNFNTGRSGKGVQAYTSWKQGLQATIGTLTGQNADSRGYTAIVDFLKHGGGSNADMLKLMQGSKWDAGGYKSGSSTSSSGAVNGITTAVATQNTIAVDPTAASRFAAAQAAAFGHSFNATGASGTNNNYNYGGITIQINGAQDPKKTGAAVADAIKPTSISKIAKK
jgi:hypothetical protein